MVNKMIPFHLLLFCSMGLAQSNMTDELKLADLQKDLPNKRWERVEDLIRDDPDSRLLSRYQDYILIQASLSGKIDVVKFYLDRGADIDKDLYRGFTLLNLAARAGHTELSKCLIEKGADLYARTEEAMTPMMFAVIHNWPEIEELLSEKGVSKDAFTETMRGDIQAVRSYLIEDPNLVHEYRGHFSLLHWAAYKGHAHLVDMLIAEGADVQGHKEYASPLTWAVRYNRDDIAKLLIDHGANVNLQNARGQTPLFISARTRITKFLLENGADPRISDVSGNTPLHGIGTKHMHTEAIRTIIDLSGYPGYPQSEAVIQAAIDEQLGVAKLLIAHGADPGARNKAGKTPSDSAREGGFHLIISFLEAEQNKL